MEDLEKILKEQIEFLTPTLIDNWGKIIIGGITFYLTTRAIKLFNQVSELTLPELDYVKLYKSPPQ